VIGSVIGRNALFLLALPVVAAASCVTQPNGTVVLDVLNVCTLSDDGALCDDGHPCTVNDVCVNKVCVGTPAADGTPCTDGDFCTIGDTCMASICVGTVAPDGTPCTDDDLCTEADSCVGGKCLSGPPKVCDDGDPCTVDMCLPASGCQSTARECAAPPDSGGGAPDTGTDGGAPGADAAPDGGAEDGSEPESEGGVTPGTDGGADRTEEDGSEPESEGGVTPGMDSGADRTEEDGSEPESEGGVTPPPVDGGADSGSARDGGGGEAALHDLRAQGGACDCALGERAPSVPMLVVVVLAGGWVRARRRQRAR